MSMTEQTSARKPAARLPVINETTLLGVIAIGFLVLHLVTAIALMSGSTRGSTTPQGEARVIHTD